MKYALIKSIIAPIMEEPPHQAEIADEALCGMTVQVFENKGEWYHIRTHYSYEGWVHEKHLLFNDELIKTWGCLKKSVVLQDYADVLDAPKVQGHLVGEITRGGLLSPIGESEENGWQKVRFCDGREGFTWGAFLGEYITTWDKNNETALRKAFTDTAKSYLGTQYRWGGKTPLGIDCSGLCSISYLLNGIIINRDAKILPQFAMHEIPFEEKNVGDLIFFPGHVAMYLGGNRYIHSTAGNNCHGVVINSFDPNADDFRADLPQKILCTGSIF